MGNPLVGAFSPAFRKALYTVFSLAGLTYTAVLAYCAATDAHQPSWVDGAAAALTVIGTGLGLTAASNVPTPDTDEAGGGEDGAVEIGLLGLVLIIILIVLLLR
jgi:hypothetical protein